MQESWAWIAVGTCKRGVESLADITHVIEPERGPEFAHAVAREPYRWALLLSLLHFVPFPTFPQSCDSPRGANALTPPSKTSNSSSLVACRMDGGSKVGSRGGGSRFPRLVLREKPLGSPSAVMKRFHTLKSKTLQCVTANAVPCKSWLAGPHYGMACAGFEARTTQHTNKKMRNGGCPAS